MEKWKMKKIINFGCIGFGFMGKTHVSNILKHPYANLKAIYSHPDLPIDKKDSKDLGDCSLYTDNWKELVDREDIDAIIIATPTHTHAEIAQYVAQMKKHIFVEKPMARTLEGANIIMESARKNNVKLFVGHVLRFFQSFSQAKQSLNQKTTDIGQVKMIRGLRYSTLPNWSSWFFNEKKSGGCILDLSIHDIDYAIWMMGKMPSEVFCKARKLPEQNVNTWVVSMTTLDFGGALAHLEASWLGASTFQWLTDH